MPTTPLHRESTESMIHKSKIQCMWKQTVYWCLYDHTHTTVTGLTSNFDIHVLVALLLCTVVSVKKMPHFSQLSLNIAQVTCKPTQWESGSVGEAHNEHRFGGEKEQWRLYSHKPTQVQPWCANTHGVDAHTNACAHVCLYMPTHAYMYLCVHAHIQACVHIMMEFSKIPKFVYRDWHHRTGDERITRRYVLELKCLFYLMLSTLHDDTITTW